MIYKILVWEANWKANAKIFWQVVYNIFSNIPVEFEVDGNIFTWDRWFQSWFLSLYFFPYYFYIFEHDNDDMIMMLSTQRVKRKFPKMVKRTRKIRRQQLRIVWVCLTILYSWHLKG